MLGLARTRRQIRNIRKYQGGWVQIIYYIIVLILSIVLAPKPPKPRSAALEDFDVPVAEEDRPIPVLFGTWRITGANVLWYGDLKSIKIKKKSLFSSTTVGYKYHLGMHLGFCHGPVDKLTKIEMGDKLAWSGNATDNTTLDINQPNLFGGEKREGGYIADVDVCMGAADQAVNTYLASQQAAPVPAYRGVFCLVSKRGTQQVPGAGIRGLLKVLTKGYVGTTPYVKAMAVTATRIEKGWHDDEVWYPEKATITLPGGGTGMNPAHIIYQCLTDPEWGMAADPVDDITDANFRAVADTLFDEEFGLNMLWNQQTSIEDFLGIVLDHIAGILAFDPSTGRYLIKLIRGDYVPADLPLYGKGTINRVESFERRSWGETVNELTLAWTNPDTGKAAEIVVQDLGNIQAQARRIPEKMDFTAINDHELIRRVAGRELLAKSLPLARIEFEALRAFNHQSGDVVRLEWEPHELLPTVFRVITVRSGTLQDSKVSVQAVEDIYALPGTEYQAETPTATPIAPIDPPDDAPPPTSAVLGTRSTPPDPDVETVNDGDRWLIGPGATGVWAGHEGEIAEADLDDDTWTFIDPGEGSIIFDQGTGQHTSVDEYGAQIPPAWTPAIPPLDEVDETTPAFDDMDLVVWDNNLLAYRKISADRVGGGSLDQTFITFADETATLANSRRLIGGTGITVDSSTPGQVTLNAGGGHYLLPLSNGDPADPQVLFSDGEIVTGVRETF
jgi:hypothetical protein